jgi:MFS family permease
VSELTTHAHEQTNAFGDDVSVPIPLSRNRDFNLLWSGQAISLFGSQLAYIGYPLLALALTHSAVDAGLVAFAGSLARVVFRLPAGAYVDRHSRKAAMLISAAVGLLALASVAIVGLLHALTFAQLVVVSALEGAVAVVFAPAEEAAIKEVVPLSQLRSALIRNQAREYAAGLAGPPVGGLLFALSRLWPFAGDAISYGAALLAVASVRSPLAAVEQQRRYLAAEIQAGLTWLWQHRLLRGAVLHLAVLNFVANSAVFAVIVSSRTHGHSGVAIGTLLAIIAVGGFAGSLVGRRLQKVLNPTTLLLGLGWLWALLLPLIAISSNLLVQAILLALLWLIAPASASTLGAYRIATTPSELVGRVSSASSLIANVTLPLGPLVAGFLFSSVGLRDALLVLLIPVLVAVVAAGSSRTMRSATQTVDVALKAHSPA